MLNAKPFRMRGDDPDLYAHMLCLSWALGLDLYFSNYFLNFKRERIIVFYIINDT